jgi:nitrogen PTS system EIIA component
MELTIEQVAQRLSVPVETVERWVQQGKIPMQQYRDRYVIRSEMLDRWAEEYQLKMCLRQPGGAGCEPADFDGIAAAMRRGGVAQGIEGDNKEACLRAAVDFIPNIAPHERPLILEKLIERERLASTGIGHGIAVPHPRTPLQIDMGLPQITTCFLARPIDFESIDHKPVSLLLILLADSTRLHLTLLSRLSFFLREAVFRNFLLSVPAADVLLQRVDQLESDDQTGGA